MVLAGTVAGWTWAPFNDATEHVPTRSRDSVLSVVSTGTTLGILAAGVLALVMGDNWRAAWTAFAVAAGAAVVPNLAILPGATDMGSQDREGWRGMLRTEAAPLAVVAACFGVVSAFYFSFAVDAVAEAGDRSSAVWPLIFLPAALVLPTMAAQPRHGGCAGHEHTLAVPGQGMHRRLRSQR